MACHRRVIGYEQCPVKPHAVQNSQPSRLIIAAALQLGQTLPLIGALS